MSERLYYVCVGGMYRRANWNGDININPWVHARQGSAKFTLEQAIKAISDNYRPEGGLGHFSCEISPCEENFS